VKKCLKIKTNGENMRNKTKHNKLKWNLSSNEGSSQSGAKTGPRNRDKCKQVPAQGVTKSISGSARPRRTQGTQGTQGTRGTQGMPRKYAKEVPPPNNATPMALQEIRDFNH